MFDIKFFEKVVPLKKKILGGKFSREQGHQLAQELEALRSKGPVILNLEKLNRKILTHGRILRFFNNLEGVVAF